MRDINKVREARRRWYSRNKEHAKSKVAERKKMLLKWFQTLKSTLFCAKCGETHMYCLEFHHENGEEKDMPLARAVHNGWSKSRLESEMKKCTVLCANCHRKVHWPLEFEEV